MSKLYCCVEGLPTCKLSTHIEDRVNGYLTKKSIPGEVIIRILSYTEKETELKAGEWRDVLICFVDTGVLVHTRLALNKV